MPLLSTCLIFYHGSYGEGKSKYQRPNFQNFLGRSLEDFFSKESMWHFETSVENVFGRI